MEIITGECIAEQLTAWGAPCQFVDFIIAPQLITYNFNIYNYLQLNKVKELVEPLTAWSGWRFNYVERSGGFAFEAERKERGVISINNFSEVLKSAPPYSLIIGQATNGDKITATLDDLTHLLVAGTTGAGKSVCLHNLILSLLCKENPQNARIILIDPKRTEFNIYKNKCIVINETQEAKSYLIWLVEEMECRHKELAKQSKTKNTGEFFKIVCVIDELADLILQDEEIKPLLIRLLQKARASGIHFIIATHGSLAKVLDYLILANLPSRLALTCASVRESMLILGHKGAEKLIGMGDAIFKAQDTTKEIRIQAPYIDITKIKFILGEENASAN